MSKSCEQWELCVAKLCGHDRAQFCGTFSRQIQWCVFVFVILSHYSRWGLVSVCDFSLSNYWVNTMCVCLVDIWVVSLTLHAISSHGISTELKICTLEKCVLIIYHLWTFYNVPFRANRYECALKINVAFSVYFVAKWGFDWTIICAR